MTATTNDRNSPASYLQRQGRAPLANNAVVPAGVIVALNAAGQVPTAGSSDVAGLVVVGRAEHAADEAAGDVDLVYTRGVFGFVMTGALAAVGQANVGRTVYLEDNQTIGLASDTVAKLPVGTLELVGDDGLGYVSLGLAGSTTGALAGDAAVSPAAAVLGDLKVIPILLPDAATADYDYITPIKVEILDVVVIKDAAGAANTIQAKSGAGTAISDAIAAAVDKAVTRAGTLDKTTRVIAAGGTIRLTNTRNNGSSAAAVFLHLLPRA